MSDRRQRPEGDRSRVAMSDSPDAASGDDPQPMRIAAVTATGVPNPAAPSKKALQAERHQEELQPAVAETSIFAQRS